MRSQAIFTGAVNKLLTFLFCFKREDIACLFIHMKSCLVGRVGLERDESDMRGCDRDGLLAQQPF